MKKAFLRASVFAFLMVFMVSSLLYAASDNTDKQPKEKYVAGELLVKFKADVPEGVKDKVHQKYGSKKIKEFSSLRIQHIKLKSDFSVEQAIEIYKADPNVEYAEPNYMRSIQNLPNDYTYPWNFERINAPAAWDITIGGSNVVIAVVDSGVDYTHEDLAGNMWMNPGEIAGNGIDDDGNGYIDDVYGINAITETGDPMDDYGHGTNCAGVIGAVGNNGVGITGLNWNVKIMACKFIGSDGIGYTSDAIGCLEYIRGMKARGGNIIATNNSYGGDSYSQAEYDAINAQRDVLFVAAAMNRGTDNDQYPAYPANNYLPNIISVTGTTENDSQSYNYGRRTVHVGAPATSIFTTSLSNNYGLTWGTSLAAPHVAGLAALVEAQDPNRSWIEIKNLVLSGGDALTSLSDTTITAKRINASGSLTCVDQSVFSILKFPSDYQIGVPVTLSSLSINCENPIGPVMVTLSGGEVIGLYDDGLQPDLAAGDGIFSVTWTPIRASELLTFSSPVGSETVRTPVLRVATNSLSTGFAGVSYYQKIEASGGLPPYSWSLQSGSLPNGLSLNSSTGEISGAPTAVGAFSFAVLVTDAELSQSTKSLSISVYEGIISEKWTRSYNITGRRSHGAAVATDSLGNVYVAGYSSIGTNSDYLTIKYDASGEVEWVRSYDSGGTDLALGIAVDTIGNIYVTGTVWANTPQANYFTIKYDPDGNVLWTKTFDRGNEDSARGIAADGNDNVYVTGYSSNGSNSDYLTVKYDQSGNEIWTKTYDNGFGDYARGIATDLHGYVYVTGTSYDAAGNGDYLTIKYDSDGNEVWPEARRYNRVRWDNAYGIAVDRSGNVYIAGASYNNPTYIDYLAVKYNASGTFEWAQVYNSGGKDYAYGVAVDSIGNVYVTGQGNNDYLTVKYDSSGNLKWTKIYDFGDYNSEGAEAVTVDKFGNIYVTGYSYDNCLTIKYQSNLHFETESFPSGFVGLPYNQPSYALGGVPPYTWSLYADSLPDGLTLNSATGEISGIPESKGTFHFILQVMDSESTIASQEFSIRIFDDYLVERWRRSYDSGLSDTPYDVAVDKNGNVYVTGGMDMGGSNTDYLTVKYDADGNVLWGRSFDRGGLQDISYAVDVDEAGNVYVTGNSYSVYVSDCLTVKYDPEGNVVWSSVYNSDSGYGIAADDLGNVYVAGASHIMKYDGDGNLVWSIPSGANDIAVSGSGSFYAISSSSVGGGSYDFLVTKYDLDGNLLWSRIYDGGPFDYGIAIAVDGSENVYVAGSVYTTTKYEYITIKYDSDGNLLWARQYGGGGQNLVFDVAVNQSGHIYVTGDSGTIKYDSSGNLLWFVGTSGRGMATDQNGNLYLTNTTGDFLTVKYENIYLRIITNSLADATTGTPYSQSLAVTNGWPPYVWAIISGNLPSGVTLDSATGVISGIPTTSSTFSFGVHVTDVHGSSDSRRFLITVYEPLTIVPSSLAYGTVDSPYSDRLSATGGLPPYSWSIPSGMLPPGLSLDRESGIISGTPTLSGTYTFAVKVTDARGTTSEKPFSISIYDTLSIPTPSPLPFGTVGLSYSYTLTATGGKPLYSWSYSGSLPPGLSLSAAGVISGTPTQKGTFDFTVQVTDANGTTSEKPLSISIYDPLSIPTPSPIPSGTIGAQYSYQLTATGGLPSYTWSVASGNLPGGLSLDSQTGIISGIPSTGGAFSFTVEARDGNSTTASKPRSITINCAVEATAGPHGTISPSGTVPVNYGGNQTFTITPADTSYYVLDVLVDGVSVGAVTSYPFYNVTANHTIRATFAQYITVTLPNGGESWTRGTTQIIRWTYAGNPGTLVKIELMKGGVVNTTIASKASIGSNGSGSYSWKIPSKQALGSDYKIRVTSTSNSNYTDISNGTFTIK